MNNRQLKEILQGIALALLVYVTLSSAVPLFLAPAYAQSAPIFSATMIASTGNPVRRQYASIIAANLRSVGIDARLFYVNFDVLVNRMFFAGSAKQGSTFDQGGYDIGFHRLGIHVTCARLQSKLRRQASILGSGRQ